MARILSEQQIQSVFEGQLAVTRDVDKALVATWRILTETILLSLKLAPEHRRKVTPLVDILLEFWGDCWLDINSTSQEKTRIAPDRVDSFIRCWLLPSRIISRYMEISDVVPYPTESRLNHDIEQLAILNDVIGKEVELMQRAVKLGAGLSISRHAFEELGKKIIFLMSLLLGPVAYDEFAQESRHMSDVINGLLDLMRGADPSKAC